MKVIQDMDISVQNTRKRGIRPTLLPTYDFANWDLASTYVTEHISLYVYVKKITKNIILVLK